MPTYPIKQPRGPSRSFLINLLFALAVNVLIKPLYLFGVEVGVQNTLGPQVYGLYFALFNSAFILQIVNDFGIHVFNNRQVAIDRGQLSSVFPGFILLKLLLGAVYLFMLYALSFLLEVKDVLPLLLLVGFNMILTSFILLFRAGVSGLGYYRIDTLLSVLDKFLMLIIIGGVLLFCKEDCFTVYHFVFGQTGALIITLLISWLVLRRYTVLKYRWLSAERLVQLLRMALPYATAVFLMTLYTRLDGVLLLRLSVDGDYEAGLYAAGYRILDALNMVVYLFAILLLPMFSRLQSSPHQLRKLLDEGFRYMWLVVVPVSTYGILYRNEIMALLYDGADAYWGTVFALLITSFVCMGLMYVFGTFLTAAGRVHSMNVAFAFTVLLNVLLNALLVPHYRAIGTASATLLTQLFIAAWVLVLCQRVLRLSLVWSYFLRAMGFLVYCGLCGFLTRHFDIGPWYWTLCIYVPAVAVGIFFFRLLLWPEFVSIFKYSRPS